MSGRQVSAVRSRLGLAVALLAWLTACTPPDTGVDPTVIAIPPDPVFSGQSVELDVAVQRGGALTGEVEVALVSPPEGVTATPVSTTTSGATLTLQVANDVASGDHQLQVSASTGSTTVTSEPVTLTVLGVQPGSVGGEVRSLLIPTPGDAGFPTAPSNMPPASFGGIDAVSMVPGEDVPLEFGQTRAVPGEVLVRFREGAALTASSTLSVNGVALRRDVGATGAGGLQLWRADDAARLTLEETIALAESLASRADVVSAMPNWLFAVTQAPVLYEYQWHYPAIDLHDAWTVQAGTSAQVEVAVLDTGYQAHVDLAGVFLPGYDFVNLDADATDGAPVGELSHGTHVSGTVVMNPANDPTAAGINRGGKIVPVKVLDDTGSGSILGIIYGMVWASGLSVPGFDPPAGTPVNDSPARVMNMSLGGRVGICPEEMAAVTSFLADQDVILVVAAGNESQDIGMFAPANCPGVLVVGATGPYDGRAYYSNFGLGVDVFAPGGNFDHLFISENDLIGSVPAAVLSTTGAAGNSDWAFSQGTSMAAPHVAGVVSLLLAQDPSLTLDEVRTTLTSTATPLSARKCDRPSGEECGAGLMNANLALGGTPSTPWPDAPTVTISLFACDDGTCTEIDDESVPDEELAGTMTRAYHTFDFADLAPGFYLIEAEMTAPTAVFQDHFGFQIVEVLPGTEINPIVEVTPSTPL